MSTDNQDENFEQQKEILDDSSLENELLEGDGENTQNKENQSEEEETRDNPPNIESDIHNFKLVTCMRDQQYLVKSMKQVMEKHLNMLGEVESITRNLATAERTRLETIREQRLATEEVRKVLVEAQKISSTIQQTPADSERQFRRLDGNVFNSTTIDATLEASHIQQPNASIGQNLEAERKAAKPQKATTTTANSAQVKPAWQSGPHRNCHRCNKTGHNESDCPLIKYDLYFCYVCRQVSSHIGTNCPKRGNENYRGGNSSRGRGKTR
ncbi:uncharacterized protein LOC123296450 [Chrysoperla carnea]|uniref:uncharacterized protein LOC123296450 n=1 Tax=Chrysoperla carnea TaxID=189513 RepID=UPI001D095744|nr:uncharacterized protein LOC123296450 [Chrysoperla carnea]